MATPIAGGEERIAQRLKAVSVGGACRRELLTHRQKCQ